MVKNLLTMCTLDVCVPNLMAQSRCPEAEFFLAEQGKKLREALGFGESLFVSGRTKWTQNLAEGSEVPWQIAASVKSVRYSSFEFFCAFKKRRNKMVC